METTISLIKRLHSCGLRPTPQRVAVFTFLRRQDHRRHPTAEEVYSALVSEYPTLSRTTVYQTLDSLQKCGLISKLAVEEGEMRFEANTSSHGHCKCTHCGKIFDFPYPELMEFPQSLEGFAVKEKHLYYKGTCKKCQAQAQKPVLQGG